MNKLIKVWKRVKRHFVNNEYKYILLLESLGRSCLAAYVIYTYQYVPNGFLQEDKISPIITKLLILIWNILPWIKLMNIVFRK